MSGGRSQEDFDPEARCVHTGGTVTESVPFLEKRTSSYDFPSVKSLSVKRSFNTSCFCVLASS